MRRVVQRTGLALLGLVAAAGFAGAGVLWWSLPPGGMAAAVPGLSAPVQVAIDADGVPRIEAANAVDAAAALGFMHARDRMFQMELMRRAASGRLSELVGGSALRLDRFNRLLGLRRAADAEAGTLAPEVRAMLEAYAAGVNAWIGARGRFAAPEFIVLGAPEPWTVADSLLWGKTMAAYLSGNWRRELQNLRLSGSLPAERVRALWPVQDGTPGPAAGLAGTAGRVLAAVPGFPDAFTLPGTASNEWAVDGGQSGTGAPLLAGDPHLAFGMPAIWYLARITTPGGTLAGATAPGVPLVVLGHNGRIAWTFTTTGADTQDVFVETAAPGGYVTPEGVRPFAVREERIRVRGGADVVMAVRETRHGPVISDLDDAGGPILALAAANLQVADTAVAGVLALNRASTLEEAGVASALISAPVQNLLVADRTGIAMFTTGRVPVRRSGDGVLPAAGADGAADWTGFAAGAALPRVVRPESGRIVNANERVAGPDFPVFMGADWFGDWRARRIRALLDARTRHGVESFAAMQVDAGSAFAEAVLPRLLLVRPGSEAGRRALARLRGWDGSMGTERGQPLLFNEWMRRFEAALRMPGGLPPGALGAEADAVARALAACDAGCEGMLAAALDEAAAAVPADARWGEMHEARFPHPVLGRLPWVGPWFTWSIGQPGDDSTVFRGSPRDEDWASVHGPAFRGVYDLAELDRSRFALAPGQSGHPLSRHAADLMRRWRDGTSLRLGPKAEAVESVALRPAAGR